MDKPIIILGGGLWGGLLAYQMTRSRPDVRFILVEKEKTFGGNHTWSFHGPDLMPEDHVLLEPFLTYSWPGHEVYFPTFSRKFESSYHSVSSSTFHQHLISTLAPAAYELGKPMTLDEAKSLSSLVIDCRGLFDAGPCGYQNFVGLELELENPHGLMIPTLMDARVKQIDGFRFIYILPHSNRCLLIEDTRYSDDPCLDAEALEKEIFQLVAERGWKIKQIIRQEKGVLPLPFENVKVSQTDGVISLAGIMHDTTGYSLPDALRLTKKILSTNFSRSALAQIVQDYRIERGADRNFFQLLNRLMFQAAPAAEKFKVLEHFYRRPECFIQDFYKGELSTWSRWRLFMGTPPVPLIAALKTFLGQKNINEVTHD